MSANEKQKEVLVGVDFGGTKILAGVFTPGIELLGKSKLSTKANRGADAVIDRIARCIRDAVDECDLDLKQVKGVGIGAPGAVDPEAGKVLNGPNLGWKDVALKKELEKRIGVPVFLDNDCNVCTLGVYEVELGAQPRHMIGVFLGTGIGAGMVINGKLYSGFNRTAGEIGHMVIDANLGEDGKPACRTFEQLASRTAIFKQIKDLVDAGRKTVLTEMLGKDLKNLRSGDLRKALKKNDKLVEEVIRNAAVYTGIMVANLVNLLNPEVVALGGGIIEALEGQMLPVITDTAKQHTMPGVSKGIRIVASKLADDAGITGAATIARRATAGSSN